MIIYFETSAIVVILNTSCKNASFALDIKSVFFFHCYYISFQDMPYFLELLVSIINRYHINELHLFWKSFEWFCVQISSDAKSFSSLSKALWSRINSCYCILFQIWNIKEHNIIVIRVINSLMGPMYLRHPILLLVALLAVTWFPYILRHPISLLVELLAVTCVPCIWDTLYYY